MSKFPGYCSIFTEVIAKKYINTQTNFFKYGLRKFLERDHHKDEIFPTTTTKKNYQNRCILRKNIGEQTFNKICTDDLLLWEIG